MQFGAYLTGIFGQSQQIYDVRNEFKRGRTKSDLDVKIAVLDGTRMAIDAQVKAGLSFVIDPMLEQYSIFEALAQNFPATVSERQENFFNNNRFYQVPKIEAGFTHFIGQVARSLYLDLLPGDGTALAVLPSPYTLMRQSKVSGYANERAAVRDLAQLIAGEAKYLFHRGVGRIQYDEPAIVVQQSLGSLKATDLDLLALGMGYCGRIPGATTSLHTYFGDAGPILNLLSQMPVDCIGVDATETRLSDISQTNFAGKELAVGLVDARDTSLEDPEILAQKLKTIAESTHANAVWLTPNTGTEPIGWAHAMKKLEVMKLALEVLRQ